MADPTGFNVLIEGAGSNYILGDNVPWSENLNLSVKFASKPLYPIDVMIFRNGEKVLSSNSLNTTYSLPEKGVYRVVVRIIPTLPPPDGKKWIPWIITNPFYIN